MNEADGMLIDDSTHPPPDDNLAMPGFGSTKPAGGDLPVFENSAAQIHALIAAFCPKIGVNGNARA